MKRCFLAVVLCLVAAVAQAQEEMPLSLQQAVKYAVEKNLDVQAELYNTAAFEADVQRYRGIYDLLLSALLNYRETRAASTTGFATGNSSLNQDTLDYNAGVSQLLPTGGTLGASFNNSWVKSRTLDRVTNKRINNEFFFSDVTLNFTQPLLQNFGREVTELNITLSRINKEGSFEQFKVRLLDTIYQVTSQYFQLISLRNDLAIRRTSLALAERILADTNARVKAGVLPAMEILNAEFGVATRQKDLIDAERAVKDQSDSLRLLLQLPLGPDIVPVDSLSAELIPLDEGAEINRALATRPEVRQLQDALLSNELQSRVARKQTQPNLLLTASYAPTGWGDTYGRNLDRVGSFDYPVWGVGLQFTYPLGNHAAENDYIKSKLRVEQSKTQIRSLQESVSNQVRTAVRAIDSTYRQLDVTRRGRAYAEERLNAFIKKNQVGLATTKDVLDVENDLVTAKGNEVNALTSYNNAVTQLWRVTGELLNREGISVSIKDADSLYERNR